jgi:hypothetical protein
VRTGARVATVISCLVIMTGDVRAQGLRDECAGASMEQSARCESVVDAASTLPARLAIAAAGGNPVAGTASTIGMRMPGSPRWSIALRTTAARAALPPIGDDAAVSSTLWSINADATVGLFNGFNLMPTVGGFGSIDVLASAGVLSVSESAGFERSSPMTWALGARVGILRESFTAPGVSVSGMYRSLPDVEFGERATDPYFETSAQHVLTVRGTVGKRILGFGLTGGVGYDRTRADVSIVYDEVDVTSQAVPVGLSGDITDSRTSFFGNVSWTMLILNFAGELGWQESADRPSGAHGNTGKGGLFGGVAVRLAI